MSLIFCILADPSNDDQQRLGREEQLAFATTA